MADTGTAATERGGGLGPVRALYQWVLSWAESPYGGLALFAIAFVESSFFPIPPDPLLMALCLGLVSRSFVFAAICTAGSVLGGLFGYWIGASAYEWLGVPILEFYGKADKFEEMRLWFNDVGNVAVFTAALTPIPYKLVTIASGAAGMNIPAFIASSVVGRGLRFFLVAGLLYWKGEVMGRFIDAHFEKLTVAFGVLLVGGFLAIRFVMH